MKKSLFTLVLLLLCLFVNGQKMTIVLTQNDKNAIYIKNKKFTSNEYIPSGIEIDSICIKENKKLDKAKKHFIYIQNVKLNGSNDAETTDKICFKVKPFTITPSGTIEIYRDSVKCSTFKTFPNSKKLKSILEKDLNCDTNYICQYNDNKTFSREFSQSKNYTIESIETEICYHNKIICKFPATRKKNNLNFAFTNNCMDSIEGPCVILLKVYLKGINKPIEVHYCSVYMTGTSNQFLIYMIIALIVIVFAVIFVVMKKRRKSAKKEETKTNGNTIDVVLKDKHKKKLKIHTINQKPTNNDKAEPDGIYEMRNGSIYRIKEGILTIYESVDNIFKEIETSDDKINELRKRPTLEEKTQLEKKVDKLQKEIESQKPIIKQENNLIQKVVDKVRIEEQKKFEIEKKNIDVEWNKKIIDNFISRKEHDQSIKKIKSEREKTIEKLKDATISANQKAEMIEKLEAEIKSNEKSIADKRTAIIKLDSEIKLIQKNARKKNMHYIYEVEDTLNEVEQLFDVVRHDVHDDVIKKEFIIPILTGVNGIGNGIATWNDDLELIMDDSEAFFGEDVLIADTDKVKDKLAKSLISKIIKMNSFSKLVRMYALSQVPFIRREFKEAGVNTIALETLYHKIHGLMTDFGYTILCPDICEEQMDNNKYEWHNSTTLFNVINIKPEDKAFIKRMGSDTIVDVIQAGFIYQDMNRRAIVATQDF